VINRVTWDNIIMPPDPNELGWKDTVRISPLEDTYVVVRPIVPTLPFGVPDSIRPLNPMMPLGAKGNTAGPNGTEAGFNNTDQNGNPIPAIENVMTNFGWEYVYHCHILSHEEMDMMRPVAVKVAEAVPDAPVLSITPRTLDLAWTDGTPVNYADPTTWGSPKGEIGFRIERAPEASPGVAGDFAEVHTSLANTTTYTDVAPDPTAAYFYRVTAWNAKGAATSNIMRVPGRPAAPTGLTAEVQANPSLASGSQVALAWTNKAVDATSIVIERAVGGGAFSIYDTLTDPTLQSYVDTAVSPGTYRYQVRAENAIGQSLPAGPVSAVVPQVASTTTVASSLNPSLVGDSVTFTATVAHATAATVPTGSVTFTANGVTTVATVDSLGVATMITAALPAGTFSVTADYSGDSLFLASSGSVSQTVDKLASTTTVTSSLNPSVYGDAVTFTMSVQPTAVGPTPSGTVQLVVDGVNSGAPVSLAAGSATATLSNLDATVAGTPHTITAVYSGDATYLTSTGDLLGGQVVAKAASTTVVSVAPSPSRFGQAVNLTATVSPGGAAVLGGTVQFFVDGVAVGGPRTVTAGVARLTWSAWTVAGHAVTAVFSGNANYLASGSAPVSHRVNRAATRTVVTSSGTPARAWSSVTFTITVTAVAPGAGIVSGRVQFQVDGRNFGPALTVTNGQAVRITSLLGAGTHRVRAIYLTSTNFSSSESTTFRQVMN
jgi:hypothetical protein